MGKNKFPIDLYRFYKVHLYGLEGVDRNFATFADIVVKQLDFDYSYDYIIKEVNDQYFSGYRFFLSKDALRRLSVFFNLEWNQYKGLIK